MSKTETSHSKVDQGLKIAIGVLLAVLGFVIVNSIQEHIVEVGDTAPNFTVTTNSGAQASLKDYRGKVVVVNFWAAWCSPCVQEAPSLNEFYKEMSPLGVVVLAVSVDRNEKMYQNFRDKLQIAFPTARDPESNVSNLYGTFRFPESYIIGKDGKVARKFAGLPDRDGQSIPWTDPQLMAYVKSLL